MNFFLKAKPNNIFKTFTRNVYIYAINKYEY